jgi:hypothetical protein
MYAIAWSDIGKGLMFVVGAVTLVMGLVLIMHKLIGDPVQEVIGGGRAEFLLPARHHVAIKIKAQDGSKITMEFGGIQVEVTDVTMEVDNEIR